MSQAWKRFFTALSVAVWAIILLSECILGSVTMTDELRWLNASHPLKVGENIMFWRPQKVGSSTLLSVLMSYSYRYNFLPRRKANSNSLCRRIARCALYSDSSHSSDSVTHLSIPQKRSLVRYIMMKIPGLEDPSTTVANITNTYDETADALPFKMSLQHEVCSLDGSLVQQNLRCAFEFDENFAKRTSFARNVEKSESAMLASEVKQLFMVREPVSRAISVYYFWGELYKIAMAKKIQQKASNESKSTSKLSIFSRKQKNEGSEEVVSIEAPEAMDHRRSLLEDTFHFFNLSALFEDQLLMQHQRGHRLLFEAADDKEKARQMKIEAIRKKKKQSHIVSAAGGEGNVSKLAIGQTWLGNRTIIDGTLFSYHGVETTVPPPNVAMEYAAKLPYLKGMPGPSYTWSLFADSPDDAVEMLNSRHTSGNRYKLNSPSGSDSNDSSGQSYSGNHGIFPIIVERLDESLVAASHYLGVSIADVVVTKPRKSLSTHPKHSEWPKEVVDIIRTKMELNGEMRVYNASNRKLDELISDLRAGTHTTTSTTVSSGERAKGKEKGDRNSVEIAQKVDFDHELKLFRALSARVSAVCMEESYLEIYRDDMKASGLTQRTYSKLREVDASFFENGHIFGFNKEILCSFDVCGSCEAHALMMHVASVGKRKGSSSSSSNKSINGQKPNENTAAEFDYGSAAACATATASTTATATAPVAADYCGISSAPLLRELVAKDPDIFKDNIAFAKCPTRFLIN